MPVVTGELIAGIEDRDGAALVTAAPDVMAMGGAEWRGSGGDFVDLLVQGRLVVLHLDNQGDLGFCGDLEVFFWQCSASSVTMAPSATPSSASNVCAAGISLDFSAMSTCASTRAVSVAKALSTWTAVRS